MPTSPHDPVLNLSALDAARAIREGRLSSRALVDAALAHIAHHDGAIGAFTQLWAGSARRHADRLDALRDRGQLVGPFHGVPTGIKDMHPVRGARVQLGSRMFRYLWSPVDDGLVGAVRGAGFVLLGKTATSELALLPVVETDLHPPTRNPWDPSRTAGGSSGGAGAGLAARYFAVAPGSDGAGSIRIPSALAGAVGLKPSRGVIPSENARIDRLGLATNGPMGRTVADVAALLDVLGGTPGRYAATAAPGHLTVGLLLQPPFGETDPAIAAAVEALARRVEALGHRVVPRPTLHGTVDEFLPLYQDLFSRVPMPLPGKLQPVTRWFREQGLRLDQARVQAAFVELTARGLAALDGVDVLITPTVPVRPPLVGATHGLGPAEQFAALAPLGSFTAVSNITGAPALSLPCGYAHGVPVGAQLVARPGQDALLLGLAAALEAHA
jgi:amidase